MQQSMTVEAAAVAAGAWLVGQGNPLLGLLWLGVGVYLYKTTDGGCESS